MELHYLFMNVKYSYQCLLTSITRQLVFTELLYEKLCILNKKFIIFIQEHCTVALKKSANNILFLLTIDTFSLGKKINKLVIKIQKSFEMSTIKEEAGNQNNLIDDAKETVLEKFLSMKDAFANLKVNDFENFFKKHTKSNIKVFSGETKAKEFLEQKQVLMNSLNEFLDDIIVETFDENNLQPVVQRVKTFINTPGLQHLAENILVNLKYQDLKFCGLLDSSFLYSVDQLMENPLFLLRKFVLGGMSKKNETDWTKIIQMTRGTNVAEIILLYFKRYLQNEKMVDFDMPCHIKKDNLQNRSEIIMKNKDGNLSIDEIVRILDPNEPPEWEKFKGMSTITWAANIGHTEIVQINFNPNKPSDFGETPIYTVTKDTTTRPIKTAYRIVKILAPWISLEQIPDTLQEILDECRRHY